MCFCTQKGELKKMKRTIYLLLLCYAVSYQTATAQQNDNNQKESIMKANEFKQLFPLGEKNDAYAAYFTGQSYLQSLSAGDVSASNVTFEPGCRNNWHIHRVARQLLLCTAGEGWYQEEGKPAQRLRPGDVVDIPVDVKHWHGAARNSWFSHVAITVPLEGSTTEWFEAVTDAEYNNLPEETNN